MPYGQILTDSITDSSGGVLAPSSSVFRNRLINSDMRIDQRNAGASVTPTADPTYTLDRWAVGLSAASKFSLQRNAGSVTPPTGFTNYLGITSLSAYSITSGDYFTVQQSIEGFNTADLAWGTASAAPITLSFWVRSSLTGTFGGSIINGAINRSYPFTYTINSANTWEKETITIAGDTSGTWATNNTTGIIVMFGLGVGTSGSGTAGSWAGTLYRSATGATSVVGTNGATFYITGVQLEKGTTATSFDYRPYGTELALCQRYARSILGNSTTSTPLANLGNISTTRTYGSFWFGNEMRSSPTASFSAANTFRTRDNGGTALTVTSISAANLTPYSCDFDVTVASGLAAGNCSSFGMTNSSTASIIFSAEL